MGTRLDVVMIGEELLLFEVWKKLIAETERLHHKLNRFDPASEISHINREAVLRPVELNEELWHIMINLKKYHHNTLGFFDATLGNFDKVILDKTHKTVEFAEKNISLDLGGYAKGYALEQIREILFQSGVTQALVNFGNSSVLAVGSHPHGEYWGIGVEDPFKPGRQLKTYELCNRSLSTSGNTLQHTGHIFNPRLRKYTTENKLVSAVSSKAVDAEVLSTALMVADEMSNLSIKKAYKNIIIDIFAV